MDEHQWPFPRLGTLARTNVLPIFFSLRATSRPVAFGDINPGFHTWLPQRFTSASSVNTNQGIKHGAGLLGYNDIMDIIYIYT